MEKTQKSLLEKIQEIKVKLDKLNLKKSGRNDYSDFNYYELGDFMPYINQLCLEARIFTKISFTDEEATLTLQDLDSTERQSYSSPIKEITIKGANEIQALGGVQTYLRRYLYMTAFDISENDLFDKTAGSEKEAPKKEAPKKAQTTLLATKGQIAMIVSLLTEEEIKKALDMVKKEKVEDLTVSEASSLITSVKRNKESEVKVDGATNS